MNIIKNGLATGLLLQFALGPVFFFIINLTLQKTIFDGLVAVLAVTIVDYFYIILAILGVGKVLEKKKVKKVFEILSSTVLIIFGSILIKAVISQKLGISANLISSDLFSSFSAVFLLTLSSPMTIIFFTSLFATKAIELNYSKRELLIFGLSTGSATFLFLGTAVILFSFLGGAIPIVVIGGLNLLVGMLLMGYGAVRLLKGIQKQAYNGS